MRLKPTRSFVVVTSCLIAACAVAVYAGTELQDDASSDQAEQIVRADGSLVADPAPLSLADVRDAGASSPEGTVLRLWFWGQWGSPSNIVAMYDPRVVSAVGEAEIAGAYSTQRGYMIGSRPEIVETVSGTRGTSVVTVEALRRGLPPDLFSFTLTRRDEAWTIAYDTLLDISLRSYARQQVLDDPEGDEVTEEARRAEFDAARDLRNAALTAK